MNRSASRPDPQRRAWLTAFAALMLAPVAPLARQAGAATAAGRALPLPDTRLLDGKLLKASDLKGKVVLVKYWATWCPLCVAEMPELQRFYAAYRKQGFEALALSLDGSSDEVELFWDGSGYQFPSAMNTPGHTQVFGQILGTPTFFLLDRSGTLRHKVVGALGYARMERLIKPLLAENVRAGSAR